MMDADAVDRHPIGPSCLAAPRSPGERPISAMHELETKIPPPIVMVLLGIAAWAAARLLPVFTYDLPFRAFAAGTLAFVGLALNVVPKLAFREAGTTANPLQPASTTRLVTSGLYRYTRNPMYLGHSIVLLAWALYLHNLLVFLSVPMFMLYVTWFQIRPEERLLSERFPDAYAAYRTQVPRWL